MSWRPLLVIANKAYSSWSMRPWLLLRHFEIPFDETTIPLSQPDTRERILRASPSGRVPALIADGLTVWDSLAICEWAAERFSDCAIWPREPNARAVARSASAEMHSSFQALRQQCPMNFLRAPKPVAFTQETLADIARIEALWEDCRARFGARGPFLFGEFSAADAMFAPVVNRLLVYGAPVGPRARAYMEAVCGLKAWSEWEQGARLEPAQWRLDRIDNAGQGAAGQSG